MALFRTVSRIARIAEQQTRLGNCLNKRGYADVPGSLSVTFACPSQCFYQSKVVKQVDVPSMSGDFGVLAGHVPTIAVLKPGVLVVHEDDSTTNKYFVSSGSVTVNEDSSMQILAEEAAPLDRLDMASIKEGLSRSQQEMSSASSEKAKAEAQIAVECYEALQKALEH